MDQYLSQKELPVSEQPYEKCEAFGPEVLSDAELLAVIIRSGSKNERAVDLAIRILSRPGQKTGLSCLFSYSQKELQKLRGIGRVKAAQLCCVSELAKRLQNGSVTHTTSFCSPKVIADAYMGRLSHSRTEEVFLLLLDIKGHKITDKLISKGTVNTSILEPREVLSTALLHEAFSIVVLHNHPSGDPAPSDSDIYATKRLNAAAQLVGVLFQDHIIIGDNCYLSLRETEAFSS